MSENLKKKIQNNLLIVFGLNIFDKAIVFLGLITLTHLLRPEDFGILAAAEILVTFVSIWNDFVFETSAIAATGKDEFDIALDMAFVNKVIFSIFLYGIICLTAKSWSNYYNDPRLFAVAQVLGLNILIPNFWFIPNTVLVKEQRFDKIIVPNVLKTASLYGSAIVMSLAGFGFWSLVFSRLLSSIVTAVAFFLIRPWKIRLAWNSRIFFNMWSYMKNMYLLIFLTFFINQIDKFVISKILSFSLLGYYIMACSFGNWASVNISAITDKVAFPLYSKLKDDIHRLNEVYLKFFKYILFLSIPILTAFVLFAEYFVMIFLGEKWLPIITPLRILCFAGFFGLIGNISNSLLKGISRLDIEVKRNAALSVFLLITLIPLTIKYGLIGSCIAVLASSALIQPLYFSYAIRTIKVQMKKILSSSIILLGSSFCAVIVYILCNRLFLHKVQWLAGKFTLSLLTYVCVYMAATFAFMRNEFIADIRTFFHVKPHNNL